jgi:hypothetical protein
MSNTGGTKSDGTGVEAIHSTDQALHVAVVGEPGGEVLEVTSRLEASNSEILLEILTELKILNTHFAEATGNLIHSYDIFKRC